MAIFWRMLLAYLLSDFTLRYDYSGKRRGWYLAPVYGLVHYAVLILFTAPFLEQKWAFGVKGWYVCAAVALCHCLIDLAGSLAFFALKIRNGLTLFLADQILHLYLILLFSGPVVSSPAGSYGSKWFAIAALFAAAAHGCTALVYFMEKELYRGTEYPRPDEMYFWIGERLVMMLFFFTAGYYWAPFALAWAAQMLYIKRVRAVDVSGINLSVSIIVPCLFGAFGRSLFYGYF